MVSDAEIVTAYANQDEFRTPLDTKMQYLIYTKNTKKGFYNINRVYISEMLIFGKNGLFGMIDSLENEMIPAIYTKFRKNINCITAIKDSLYSIIDKNGNTLMPLEYKYIQELEEDTNENRKTATFIKEGKRGFYDHTFTEIIPPTYDNATPFNCGLAGVEIDGYWGFIDKNANLVLPAIYDNSTHFQESCVAYVTINRKSFFINKEGKCVKYCD